MVFVTGQEYVNSHYFPIYPLDKLLTLIERKLISTQAQDPIISAAKIVISWIFKFLRIAFFVKDIFHVMIGSIFLCFHLQIYIYIYTYLNIYLYVHLFVKVEN